MPPTLRAPGVSGGRRAEEIALLVAGRQRLRPHAGDDVEVEIAQAVLILHVVDCANADGDAKPLQVGLVKEDAALVTLVLAQELDADRLRRWR